MSTFITAHVITCMTRQDLDRLLRRLLKDAGTGEFQLDEVRCDTVSGRMVCTWTAPDQAQLVEWLSQHHIRFRGQEEWCMRVQMEAQDGKMVTTP